MDVCSEKLYRDKKCSVNICEVRLATFALTTYALISWFLLIDWLIDWSIDLLTDWIWLIDSLCVDKFIFHNDPTSM